MRPLTVDDVDVQGQRVLLRTNYDIDTSGHTAQDDLLLRTSLPTIRSLRERGARIAICSHRGRPRGRRVAALSNRRLAAYLGRALETSVVAVGDCVGPAAESAVAALRPGDVVLLENVRFHAGEEANDDAFARRLAALADVYVDDAFGVVEHTHASIVGVPRYLPSAMGSALDHELTRLAQVVNGLAHPVVLVIGGARPHETLPALERLLPIADVICLTGVPANTVLWARGVEVGESRVRDDDHEALAAAMRFTRAAAHAHAGMRLVLPHDVMVAPVHDEEPSPKVVPAHLVRPDARIVDIGPRTVHVVTRALRHAATAVWIGAPGVAERMSSASGSRALARACAASSARTIVGGGQAVAALERAGATGRIWHVTTGGGAFLRWLSGRALPGVEALVAARAARAPTRVRPTDVAG